MGYNRYDTAAGVKESLDHIRKTMGKLAILNKEYGIHGAYQNHSGNRFGGPVWDIWEVIRDLDPEWIGCQYDIRHAFVEGAQSWPLALQLLKDHIRYMVIKDFRWEESEGEWRIRNVPVGEGMVDFNSFFSRLSELNIAGPLSLHIEYPLFSDAMKTPEEQRESAIQFIAKDVASLRSLLVNAKLIQIYYA
jgi:sugar phosphate isomerase/epimerase